VESSQGSCPSPGEYYWSDACDGNEEEDSIETSMDSHYFEPLPPPTGKHINDNRATCVEPEDDDGSDELTSKPLTE